MHSFEGFDAQKMLDCLQYVEKCFGWLTTSELSQFSSFRLLDLKAINDMTAALTLLLSKLNFLRNSLLPIYRLPVELLVTIFEYFVRMDRPIPRLGDYDRSSSYSAALLRVSTLALVSQHWHGIVTRAPSLWSEIFYPVHQDDKPNGQSTSLSVALRSFARSGTIPLAVAYDTGEYGSSPALQDQIAQQLVRVQDLRVRTGRYSWDEISFLFNHAAPQLQTLHLNGDEGQLPDDPDAFGFHRSILDKSNSPILCALSVSTCSWNQARLSTNLRCLCIIEQFWRNAQDVLKTCIALAALPVLEELVLTYNEGPNQSPARVENGKYSLPSLKHLMMKEIGGARNHVLASHFLSVLRLPNDCVQRIDVHEVGRWVSTLPGQPGLNIKQAQRVYADTERLIGVRGCSAVCFSSAMDIPSGIEILCPQLNAITELWLGIPVSNEICSELSSVAKLVFTNNSSLESFEYIEEDDLSSVNEIHAFPQDQHFESCRGLYHFLQARHKTGETLKTLRFFATVNRSNPMPITEEDLRDRYTILCSRFKKIVLDVSFEIVTELPRMELPARCTTPSTLHSYWNLKDWATVDPFVASGSQSVAPSLASFTAGSDSNADSDSDLDSDSDSNSVVSTGPDSEIDQSD